MKHDIGALDPLTDRSGVGEVAPNDFGQATALDVLYDGVRLFLWPYQYSQAQRVCLFRNALHRLATHIAGGPGQENCLAAVGHDAFPKLCDVNRTLAFQ